MPDHRKTILTLLDEIKDPCSVANGTPMGLVEMGLIDQLEITDAGAVTIHLRLTSPFCHMIGFFKIEAQRLLSSLSHITSVALIADKGLDWSPDRMSPTARARRTAHLQDLQPTAKAA